MLQIKPDLTSDEARTILHNTATADSFAGAVPNHTWGFGKINVKAALDSLCATYQGTDVTSQVQIRRTGFRRIRRRDIFVETVTIKNTGPAISGPVSLVLDGLEAALFQP